MERIVLFKGESAYGTLDFWTDELAEAFTFLGCEPVVIDLTDKFVLLENLHEAFSKPVRFCFSFNGMGCELQEFCSLFDKAAIPFIGAMVDPPFYHDERLKIRGRNLFFTFSDPAHVKHAVRCYPGGHYAYLPHAASVVPEIGEKDKEIIFIGGFADPEAVRKSWKENMPPPVRRLLEEVVEARLADPSLDDEEAVSLVLGAKGMDFSPDLERFSEKLYIRVNYYIRNQRRLRCLQALDDAGISVVLYNDAWKGVRFRCHACKPTISYREALQEIARSKCVLNVGPAHVGGAHERVLSAMAQNAVAVTDDSKFYHEHFTDGEDIIIYSWERLEEMPARVEEVLKNGRERAEIAARGRKRVLDGHAWDSRAKRILEIADSFDAIVNY